MDQTQNNSNQLTADEISSLHGEDLKKALAERLQGFKDEVAQIDSSLEGVKEEVDNMPEIDEKKVDEEDSAAIAEMIKKLDDDLNSAAVDLATDDQILEDVNSVDEGEGDSEGLDTEELTA